MSVSETYNARRDRLREIHREIMEHDDLTWYNAMRKICALTGRAEWTVRIWMSRRKDTRTIPADTLALLEIRWQRSTEAEHE